MTNLTIAQIEHANDIGPGETERGAEIRRTLDYVLQPRPGDTMDEETKAAWTCIVIGVVVVVLFCGALAFIIANSRMFTG